MSCRTDLYAHPLTFDRVLDFDLDFLFSLSDAECLRFHTGALINGECVWIFHPARRFFHRTLDCFMSADRTDGEEDIYKIAQMEALRHIKLGIGRDGGESCGTRVAGGSSILEFIHSFIESKNDRV